MKRICLALALVASAGVAQAGGYLTNTNQHISFLRNPARNASTEIDALYSNPAGISFLRDGWHLSLNIQSAYQNRNMTSTFTPFALNADGKSSTTGDRLFEGKVKAPVIPSIFAAYKKDKWTFGGHIAVSGGGGRAKFANGLPKMTESNISLIPALLNQALATAAPGTRIGQYQYATELSGSQYVFSATVGAAYQINPNLSVYAGVRANIASNAYEGYIRNIEANIGGNMVNVSQFLLNQANRAEQAAHQLANAGQAAQADQLNSLATTARRYAVAAGDKEVDLTQSGFGISPILGVHYKVGKLDLAAKYEFRTAITVKNKTSQNTLGLSEFNDGVETGNDIPSLLSIGASYSVLHNLRVSAGFHHYWDKNANMAGGKQDKLSGNTTEWLAGVEYDLNQRLTLSAGGQITNYGLSDAFQSDLSFFNDSYSLGFGLKYKLTDKINLNAAYFFTDYSDYTKKEEIQTLPFTTTYSRTNQVFGLGVDFQL